MQFEQVQMEQAINEFPIKIGMKNESIASGFKHIYPFVAG